MSILFAATYPDRTTGLFLYGTFAVGPLVGNDNPGGPRWAEVNTWLNDALDHWGEGRTLPLFNPSMAGDAAFRRGWARFERAALSPGMARALWQLVATIDVRPVLPAIRVPTLVIRRSGEFMPLELHRHLADTIPGAQYVELEGDHIPNTGDVEAIVDEVRAFLTGVREGPRVDRVLATVLFTDIVGSTERAATLGDRRWRDVLESHQEIVRGELARFRGREVKTLGDGFLATFDGPARAIRSAVAIRDGVRRLGVEIKGGLHTGECEVMDDDVGGIAVHIGARVAASASPGEILVSSTVKDLVAGSGLRFADRGAHSLHGVPGEWRLFAVEA